MNRFIKLVPLGAALALTVATASAQTPAAPANTTSAPTTAVGVTPQAAAEANQKAVPRSDTGTLVRTSPSSADKARAALNGAGTGTATTNTQVAASPSATSGTTRRARADRN